MYKVANIIEAYVQGQQVVLFMQLFKDPDSSNHHMVPPALRKWSSYQQHPHHLETY